MNPNHRILFFGTPQFAAKILRDLLNSGFKISAVITAPDKPSGRGLTITSSDVKRVAEEYKIDILQPTNLKDESFINNIKQLSPDLAIVIAFRMLPEVLWKIPKFGTFNLHASLLPNLRGAAPINWAIINGLESTGVTTFMINNIIDAGSIMYKKEIEIDLNDNFASLHDKLMNIGSDLTIKTAKSILSGTVSLTPQNELVNLDNKYLDAPKLSKENTRIDWNNGQKKTVDFIRGLSPFPGAHTSLVSSDSKEIRVKIFSSKIINEYHNLPCGTILTDEKRYINVVVSDGVVGIEELQLEGKKKLNIREFLAGFRDIKLYQFR